MLDKLRDKLYESIKLYGLDNPITLSLSERIDLLIVREQKKQKKNLK